MDHGWLLKEVLRGIHTYARRGELRFNDGERGEGKFASPRACVYGVASTSGATAIQSFKTGGEMNIY